MAVPRLGGWDHLSPLNNPPYRPTSLLWYTILYIPFTTKDSSSTFHTSWSTAEEIKQHCARWAFGWVTCTTDHCRSRCKFRSRPTPHAFIHWMGDHLEIPVADGFMVHSLCGPKGAILITFPVHCSHWPWLTTSAPTPPLHGSLWPKLMCTWTVTHLPHFDHEEGGSMYLEDISHLLTSTLCKEPRTCQHQQWTTVKA